MLVFQICIVAFGIGCAFSPTLEAYTILRFMVALFLHGGYVACFVYGKISTVST